MWTFRGGRLTSIFPFLFVVNWSGHSIPFSTTCTVNFLYSGHCRDLEVVSSLARVRNSGSSFQSNVCNLLLPGLAVVCIIGVSVMAGCPQGESWLYNFSSAFFDDFFWLFLFTLRLLFASLGPKFNLSRDDCILLLNLRCHMALVCYFPARHS